MTGELKTIVDQKREAREIPFVQVPPGTMEAELDERIRIFEQRYERTSEQMDQLVSLDAVRETAEIIEWMQAYDVREWLRERTRTTGTH